MNLELRKFAKFVDKTFIEGGKEAKEPVLLVSVAAVFKNPWHGQGFVENLRPAILDLAPKLGDLLVPELIKEIGSPEKILANIFSGEPISLISSGTSKSPNFGARSKIAGLKFSTNPCPCHGFLNTAATETSKTGSFASLPPSMKVLSTNFANFLNSKFIFFLCA